MSFLGNAIDARRLRLSNRGADHPFPREQGIASYGSVRSVTVQAAVRQGDGVLGVASGTGFLIEGPALRFLFSKTPDLRLHFNNCLEVDIHGKQLAANELTCGVLVSDG